MTEENKLSINESSISGSEMPGHEKSTTRRSSAELDVQAPRDNEFNSANPEILSDSELSNNDKVVDGEVIEADEGS